MFKQILHPIHPSWVFYAGVWGVIVGLIFGVIIGQSIFSHLASLLFAISLILLCLHFSSIFTAALTFLAGFILGNYRISQDLLSQAIFRDYVGQTVVIVGTLAEDPDDNGSTLSLRLQNLRLFPSVSEVNANSPPIPGLLYITLSNQDYQLERSDQLTLEGKLQPGFGNFIGKVSRPQLLAVDRVSPGDIFARFKHWFANLVRDFIPSPEVDLGLGYLMGMKSGLSEDFSEALRSVGMTHVVVASGAHLAILTGAARKIFGKISKFAGTLFSLLMIAAFVLIVGFTPSMTRAALVASLSLLVGYVGRKFTPFRLISFVAMVTLLINPSHFLNLGWQLSFASFFAILILVPRLTATFYGGKRPPWLASMLITSLATSLICSPILIYSFGTMSFLSFVANLVILPTLPYAMLGMMLTGVTSFLPFLPILVAKLTTLLLDLHIWLVNSLSTQTAFILELPSADPRIFLLYLPVLVYLTFPTLRHTIKSPHASPQHEIRPS